MRFVARVIHNMKPSEHNDMLLNAAIILTFTFTLHIVVHLVGTYIIVELPGSWRIGSMGEASPISIAGLVVAICVMISLLSIIRLVHVPKKTILWVMTLIIPVIMSAGTAVYACMADGCARYGKQMLEDELKLIDTYIQYQEASGRRVGSGILDDKRRIEEQLGR